MLRVGAYAGGGGGGIVGLLLPQVHAAPAHPPQLQAAGPPHLVKLEVPFVAGIALEPAPDLHGRPWIAHERRYGARPALRHTVRLIRGALRDRHLTPGERPVHGGISQWIAVDPEGPSGACEVRVDEEEAE